MDALTVGVKAKKVNWVLDADIRDFFSTLDQAWLMKFLEHRIADRRVLRLIRKWLNAGVIEEGNWSETPEGTPQGGSASPLLANVYLHYVFDRWARQWRRRHARGDVIVTRFADDFIVGFEHLGDAKQFLADLRARFAESLGSCTPTRRASSSSGGSPPSDVGHVASASRKRSTSWGFTQICATTKNGRFRLKRITISKRMRAKLKQVKTELRRRRHRPVPEQGKTAGKRGARAPRLLRRSRQQPSGPGLWTQVIRHWCAALRERSPRHRLNWDRMNRLVTRWLPPARIVHPFPEDRFYATT